MAAGCMLQCLGKTICGFLQCIFALVLTAFSFGLVFAVSFSLTWVLMAVMTIISVPLLPLLLVLYFMTHLVQLIRSRADNNEVAKFRGGLAYWIAMCFNSLTTSFFICFLIFKCSPNLKHHHSHDLPIWKWMAVFTIICLFCCYTMNVRYYLGYVRLKLFKRNGDRVHLYEGLMGLINCGLFLLAEFSAVRVAPVLKQPTILGLEVWKWVHLILLALLGHNVICIVTSLGVMGLRARYKHINGQEYPTSATEGRSRSSRASGDQMDGKQKSARLRCFYGTTSCLVRPLHKIWGFLVYRKGKGDWKNYVVYFAEGLRRSLNFLLTSLLFLLTWVLYFGSRLDRKSPLIGEVYLYAMWTLACVFIISFFWVVKNGIVLSWAANVVYNRFHEKILKRSTQLWLLGILGGPNFDVLKIWKKEDRGTTAAEDDEDEPEKETQQESQVGDKGQHNIDIDGRREDQYNEVDDPEGSTRCEAKRKDIDTSPPKTKKRRRLETKAKEILVPCYPPPKVLPIHDIMRMATYFLEAEDTLAKNNYVPHFCKQWHRINLHGNLLNPDTTLEVLHQEQISEEDLDILRKELQKVSIDNKFENWVKQAHKTSLALARSLSGAKEVVDCLNRLIAWLLLGTMIVLWLLVTGIATTKVIVLIASPVLAASFIFGDTCKSFFQGIMFTYVLHPFNVGDLCTIDNTQMEVKRIGIWKTIFSRVGSFDEVVYPNSLLATVAIVNHKGDVDPDDYVELSLNSSIRKSEIEELKTRIEGYLRQNDATIKPHSFGVVMKELGDSIKMGVYFKHDETKISDMLSTEGLQIKTKTRDMLLLQIKSYLDDKQKMKQNHLSIQ